MSEEQINKLMNRFDEILLKLEHIESRLMQQSLPVKEALDLHRKEICSRIISNAVKRISGKTTEAEKLAILRQEGG